MTTAARAQRRTFSSEAELADACRRLRLTLSGQHQVREEELADAWPADEAKAGWGEWTFTYGQLQRMFGRERGGQGSSRDAAAERAALAAQHEEPEPELLSDGTTVLVYPKGFRALCWFEDRDTLLRETLALRDRLLAAIEAGSLLAGDVGPGELLALGRETEARALAEMAAQACTPGTKLVADLPPDRVARFLDLSPFDLLAIHAAHHRVNYGRAQAARALAPQRQPAGETRTASWGGWLAQIAYRERTTVDEVSNKRSFAALRVTYDLAVPGDEDLLGEE